jgi:hypothetical protein
MSVMDKIAVAAISSIGGIMVFVLFDRLIVFAANHW